MPEENATVGVASARDQGSDTNSTFSGGTALSGCREEGIDRWPLSLHYPPYEHLGGKESDHAVTTKDIKGWLVNIFKYIRLCCYLSRWWLLQIGIATLCIKTMTWWAPLDFKISRPINMTRVTRHIDPPDISVIFKRENNWQDPTCSKGELEDLMTDDFELGGSGAWSPTFMARFNSLLETRRWTLVTGDPQSIHVDSHSSYRAFAEAFPHLDRPSTYLDPISSSSRDESLGVRLNENLEESEIKDSLLTAESCNLLTSCCELLLDIYYFDNIAFVLSGLFKDATIISADRPSFHTSHDQRRSKSGFDELVLTIILTYGIHLVTLVPSIAHARYANILVASRSMICYYLEPRLTFGKKRVRWICSKCGRPLYDDFQEIRPGAIAKLQQDLYERYENTNKRANSEGTGSSRNSHDGKSRNSKRSFGQWWLCWRSSGGRSPMLPLHKDQNTPSQDQDITIATRPSEKVFLLLCIPHRKWATKLVHMDLCTLLSDQLFFTELRTQYKSMQGKWRPWFSLKQLTRIEFVQFELHKNELVDIRMRNVLPPETRDDYRYRPAPPEYMPPVGENLLMHLYEHAEDADDDAFCLDRIPKKLRERLVRPQRSSRVGWGVHLKEGLNLKKMCIFGLLGLFLSASFGVIWSVKRGDVQGGFGVAAFVMAALTFTIGIVQATLEPK